MYYVDENNDNSISYDEFKIVFGPIMKGPLTLIDPMKNTSLNLQQERRKEEILKMCSKKFLENKVSIFTIFSEYETKKDVVIIEKFKQAFNQINRTYKLDLNRNQKIFVFNHMAQRNKMGQVNYKDFFGEFVPKELSLYDKKRL